MNFYVSYHGSSQKSTDFFGPLTRGKAYQLFFRYAVPQMVGLLFNSVYTIVDGIFIGNRLGWGAMIAGTLSNVALDYVFMYPFNL